MKNPTLAALILKAALYGAAARGEIDDADALIRLLAPAAEEIETAATAELAKKDAQIEALEASHAAQRAEWEDKLAVETKRAAQAEADAVSLTGTPQPGPLERPHGYYVYFLWGAGDELLYVGMSTNILSRLGQHLVRSDRGWRVHRVTVQECPDEKTMRSVEARMIWHHNPPWNTVGIPDQ